MNGFRPSHILLGAHTIGEETDVSKPQLIAVAPGGVIPHPQYEYTSHYYDIALIRLAETPKLGPMVRPACLHTGDPYVQGSLIASGWGRLYFGNKSQIRDTVFGGVHFETVFFQGARQVKPS